MGYDCLSSTEMSLCGLQTRKTSQEVRRKAEIKRNEEAETHLTKLEIPGKDTRKRQKVKGEEGFDYLNIQ